jgi:Fic-DOC domain mobile mystery protein B
MAGFGTAPGETPIDPSGLKVKGITTRGQLNILEADGIRKVLLKYLAKTPTRRSARFNYSWALKLHREMFGDVWNWAGVLRTNDLNIGVPWKQVESRLFTLLADLVSWEQSGVELLDQAVMLHHRAVEIHPFCNGNGRWARMLANIWLKLHKHPLTLWPEEVIGTQSVVRAEYLDAIKAADRGDYEPLTDLHKRFTAAGP